MASKQGVAWQRHRRFGVTRTRVGTLSTPVTRAATPLAASRCRRAKEKMLPSNGIAACCTPSSSGNARIASITAMVCMDGRVMSVPDFEFIVADLLGLPNNDVPLEADSEERAHDEYRLIIVDDSAVIRHNIKRLLRDAGYKHITVCTDGQHAWETILAEANKIAEDGVDPYDLILTDIEMPRMDGLHLCKRLKDHPQLQHMPVVIFSSLVNEGNMNKGAAVGADCQVTKFEGCMVLEAIAECLVRHDKLRKHRKMNARVA